MAKTWLSVTVELLGGGGQDLWPWPGRIFAVGPSHTFAQFAEAIDIAFARWDHAHLSMFTLADGRIVTDPESGDELASDPDCPLAERVDIGTARVARTVERGAEFQYTFDLGDDWTHRCVVADEGLFPRWQTFSTDREWGRARELLAVEGIRVGSGRPEGESTPSP